MGVEEWCGRRVQQRDFAKRFRTGVQRRRRRRRRRGRRLNSENPNQRFRNETYGNI